MTEKRDDAIDISAPAHPIFARLRERAKWLESRSFAVLNGGIEREAADMLEFFFGQMQMHSPDMGGNHSYRFRNASWPMTNCKGPSAEDAVNAAIQEIQRERDQSA